MDFTVTLRINVSRLLKTFQDFSRLSHRKKEVLKTFRDIFFLIRTFHDSVIVKTFQDFLRLDVWTFQDFSRLFKTFHDGELQNESCQLRSFFKMFQDFSRLAMFKTFQDFSRLSLR